MDGVPIHNIYIIILYAQRQRCPRVPYTAAEIDIFN